jgi:urate oxidase
MKRVSKGASLQGRDAEAAPFDTPPLRYGYSGCYLTAESGCPHAWCRVTSIEIGANRYGKGRVNVARVIRHEGYDDYRNVTIDVFLQGDFDDAFLLGDNQQIVPTDTMKNTVWAFAAEYLAGSIEDYGVALAGHFVSDFEPVTTAEIGLEEHLWRRVKIRDQPDPHAFTAAGPELRMALITSTGDDVWIKSGFSGLPILKTHGSAFEEFTRDKYTTLWEAPDRMLATEITASWLYTTTATDFDETRQNVRGILIETFVEHNSHSVQHSLYAMGAAVLAEHDTIAEITLTLPNKHHYEVDLRPFGIKSEEVFFPVKDPHGMIEGTIRRSY